MEHRTFQTDIIYYSIETKNKIVYTYIEACTHIPTTYSYFFWLQSFNAVKLKEKIIPNNICFN